MVGVKVVGVILTVALLVTPAATARQCSSSLPRIMLLSAAFVWIAGIGGLYAAYYSRIAPASLVVLLLGAMFAASIAWRYYTERRDPHAD